MKEITITRTQEQELNQYVSQHIEKCFEWLEMVENSEDFKLQEGNHFEPFAVFCACDTCVQRETLHAAFKYLENQNLLKLKTND